MAMLISLNYLVNTTLRTTSPALSHIKSTYTTSSTCGHNCTWRNGRPCDVCTLPHTSDRRFPIELGNTFTGQGTLRVLALYFPTRFTDPLPVPPLRGSSSAPVSSSAHTHPFRSARFQTAALGCACRDPLTEGIHDGKHRPVACILGCGVLFCRELAELAPRGGVCAQGIAVT